MKGWGVTLIKRSISFGILLTVIILQCLSVNVYANGTANYKVYIKYYQRNSIIIQFPQIKGLTNEKKQKEINYLLEHEIFSYVTDLFNFYFEIENKPKVTNILQTISNTTDETLEFKCYPSFSNNHLLSIRYSVYGYSRGAAHPNTWGYAYNIDLDGLKVLKLDDMLKIDKSILDYKGNVIFDRDYDPKPEKDRYKLIDVLNYSGMYTKTEIVNKLLSDSISWYITKPKGVSFFFNVQNHDEEFELSFQDIKNLLKTRYLRTLTEQIK